jgi:3-deoxy-D-arabino-heptulosonate 7-phosphate (DAHP) synthase class II
MKAVTAMKIGRHDDGVMLSLNCCCVVICLGCKDVNDVMPKVLSVVPTRSEEVVTSRPVHNGTVLPGCVVSCRVFIDD